MIIVEQQLWADVLSLAITDAIEGATESSGSTRSKKYRQNKIDGIQEARDYITKPNRDFDQVCSNAGVDPDAVRDHVIPKIEAAPTPAEIVDARHKPGRKRNQRTLTFQGKSLLIPEWANITGLSGHVIHGRLRLGWSVEHTLTTPHEPRVFKKAAA